jgi:hypothetical protein
MSGKSSDERLIPTVKKAAGEYFGKEPDDVMIHESRMTVVMGVPMKPTRKVWARIILEGQSYEVFLNVSADGEYDGFRVIE